MRVVCFLAVCGFSLHAATFGKVVPLLGGGSDIVLDESHSRLYLTSSATNLVQVYSLAQNKFLAAIPTDTEPLAAAISRSGQFLYVTCYASSVVDVIDLTAMAVTNRISLPSKPEGIAVASDERVLISTTGSGTTNVLLLYDPSPNSKAPLTSLLVAPVAPLAPTFPAPASRAFLAAHSQLRATRDGSLIVGLHVTNATSGVGVVFVYQASSGTVLRARTLTTGFLSALAISDDGTRILCGAQLFDASTMQLLGTLNTANSTFPITPTTTASSFATQANQGGAVFAPSGTTLYTVYNVDPVNAAGNIGQLMMADPDNLLITMGIQTPEFFAGKMVVGADGGNAYALSDSGFVALPLSTIPQSALAEPSTGVVLLANDQCGVSTTSTAAVAIENPGKVKATVNVSLLQYPGVAGQANANTEPTPRATQSGISFSFNSTLTRGYGTINPPHDFLLQSTDAINIPDRVRVYQNFRDADDRGTILPIVTGIASTPQLTDLVYDAPRQRIYIANTGLNRVEVYDIGTQGFLAPIKVGQLPVSLALTPDGTLLYVANSGGESISMVDPVKMVSTGLVVYPPIQFASNLPPILPSVIAAGVSGLQIVMNTAGTTNGQLWKVVGNSALPRGVSTIIGSNATTGAPSPIPLPAQMATSAEGRFILLVSSAGFVYLYDADVDDFVAGRQLFMTQPTGYEGPIAAGPNGQYFVVDGVLLNQALVQVASSSGLISAVTANGTSSYAIYSTPASAANALPTTQPSVQVLNANTGNPTLQIPALEGPISQATATARVPIAGRTMAINSTGTVAYVITTSGLSIINLTSVPASARPLPNQRGTVNLGSYQTAIAPNGLISIFGQNLASSAVATGTPLPLILGGTCVTLNNIALPLFMTSAAQINAQVPPGTAAGSFPLVVRSIANQAASASQQITISKFAPAVLVDATGQILLYHADGSFVNKMNPANRDEPLVMYAVGLGATTGGAVTSGNPSPTNPLAVSPTAAVYFGDPSWVQAAIIVDFAGLAPGMIGIYQLNLRVPGFHISGDSLIVTITAGGVSSPSTGPVIPQVSVN